MKNYVKEYKGYKVPEGATHWLVNGFAKWDDNKSISVIGCFQGATWKKCSYGMLPNAIELPEAPQEWNGEGLPPVGTLCTISADGFEYLFSAASNELSSITENTELVVVGHCTRHDNGAECVTLMARDSKDARGFTTVNPDFVSPLKTQQEKDREAFVKGLVKVLNSVPNGASLSDLHTMAEKAYDAGYAAPKATDNDKK